MTLDVRYSFAFSPQGRFDLIMGSPLTAQYTPAQLAALQSENHDHQIFLYVIIFTVLVILGTVVRIWCRHLKKSIGFDDGLVVFATVTRSLSSDGEGWS